MLIPSKLVEIIKKSLDKDDGECYSVQGNPSKLVGVEREWTDENFNQGKIRLESHG